LSAAAQLWFNCLRCSQLILWETEWIVGRNGVN
jgi:hypothetical protein